MNGWRRESREEREPGGERARRRERDGARAHLLSLGSSVSWMETANLLVELKGISATFLFFALNAATSGEANSTYFRKADSEASPGWAGQNGNSEEGGWRRRGEEGGGGDRREEKGRGGGMRMEEE